MHKAVLKTVTALILMGGSSVFAQTEAIDSQKPPAGFVAPKPSQARDLSMAKYAKDSFLDGEEGIVGLRVLVRANGSVSKSEIVQASGSARLDKYAQDLVVDWNYQPATVNGAPVDAWIPVNIIWALQTLRFNLSPAQAANMITYYPKASIAAGEGGPDTLHFLVGPDGKVAKVLIDRSSGHRRLDDAAVNMLKSGFHFSPVTLSTGEKIAAWYRLDLVWAISGLKDKDDSPCFATRGTINPEIVIQNCTQFLTDSGLTPYQRGTAYRARGIAHHFKSEFDLAIADFDTGIKLSPGSADIFISRAITNLNKGQRDLALSDLESAVQVEPLSYDPYLARAKTYFDSGQLDRALGDFQKAMSLPTVNQHELLASRCEFLTYIGRPQDGLADCEKSLKLQPKSASTLDTRGRAYFKLGQYQSAIKDFDDALRIESHYSPSLYARGVAKLKLGNNQGQVDIDAAMAIDPTVSSRLNELK